MGRFGSKIDKKKLGKGKPNSCRGSGNWSSAVSWAQLIKGGAHPSPSLPNPSLIRKRYPFTAGLTERVFQSSHGTAQPRTHALRRHSAP